MDIMILKLLRFWFSILLVAPLGLTAQVVTGSWYGKADIILDGHPNTYLTELTLRQKGNQVEGVFGYYFKTQYRSFLIKGRYDATSRLLMIRNIPVTYFNSNLEDVPADCFMTLEASLTVARSKSSLKGYILRDSIHRHTCPDLIVQLTRDPASNVDSILAAAKALEFNWKQNTSNSQATAELVNKSITAKDLAPVRVRELSEATRDQLRKELENEVRAELRKELEAEVREQIKKDMALQFLQDLKKEIEQKLTTSIKREIEDQVKNEIRKEFEAQIRQELKKEIEQQVRTELRKEFEEQIAAATQQLSPSGPSSSSGKTQATGSTKGLKAPTDSSSVADATSKSAIGSTGNTSGSALKTRNSNRTDSVTQTNAASTNTKKSNRSLFGRKQPISGTDVSTGSTAVAKSTVTNRVSPTTADTGFNSKNSLASGTLGSNNTGKGRTNSATGSTSGNSGNTTSSLTNSDSTEAVSDDRAAGKGQVLPGIRIFSRERNKQNRSTPSRTTGTETLQAASSKERQPGENEVMAGSQSTRSRSDVLRDSIAGKDRMIKASIPTDSDSRMRSDRDASAPEATGSNRSATASVKERSETDEEASRKRLISGMASSENNRSREVTSSEKKLKAVKAFEERMLYISQEIEISSDSIRVIFYDNGFVDDDTITVFYNKVPVLEKQRLTDKGLELGIKLDSKSDLHDLSMFAENVGSIPPNTALMVIYDGDERHEIFLSSTMRVNGTVRMKKKKL